MKEMGKVKKKKGYSSRENMGYAFIAPFVLVFLTFNIYPVVRTLYLSFTDYSGFNIPTWVGMGNYIRVFKDKLLWEAFGNTIRIWGVNIILQLGIAFLLTIVFSDMKYRTRGLSMFRALFYLPNLIAATSVAYLFKTMMDWKYGSFNQIIKGLGIVNEGVDWMGTPPLLRTVVGVVGGSH